MEYKIVRLNSSYSNDQDLIKLLENNWTILRADSQSVSIAGSIAGSRDVYRGDIIYILKKDNSPVKEGGQIYG